MQKMKTVKYTEKNAVSIITINRPDVMNSFDELLRSELHEAIKHSADNKDIKAVIINGKGRNFCAGADLKDTKDLDKTIESIQYNKWNYSVKSKKCCTNSKTSIEIFYPFLY